KQINSSGTRIDLRQGDGRGDTVMAGAGSSSGSSSSDLGVPIEGSQLRLAIADPETRIFLTRNLWVLIPATLLSLLGGFFALWMRQVGMQGAAAALRPGKRSAADEITFAQILEQEPTHVKPSAPTATKSTSAPPEK